MQPLYPRQPVYAALCLRCECRLLRYHHHCCFITTTLAALNLAHAKQGISYTDLKFHIDKYIMSNWHDDWNNVGANKLWIGSSPTDGQDRMALSSVVPILVIHS